MKTVSVERDDILSLISCARDYGFEDDVLFDAFRQWLGPLSEAEIQEYADSYLTAEMRAQGYGEEDREEIYERLTEFAKGYQ